MWKSYHIYNTEYNEFLSKVKDLKQNFVEGENSVFFTLYTDMKGPHYRLRIRKICIKYKVQIYEELTKFFPDKRIEERLYDPEVIKYGKNLEAYELFSTEISEFLILNKSKFITEVETVNILLGLMKTILEKFNLYDVTQIEKSVGFWSNSKKFFKSSIDHQMYLQIVPNVYFYKYIKKSVEMLCVTTKCESRELCFNLIHLAVNRFNFNLKDECLLYYKLYELKEDK